MPSPPACPEAVELRGLTKRFGDTVANSNINLRVKAGTIHGIVGENGAGKSTAMKMLYGLVRPDGGDILIHGEKCQWSSPGDAIKKGIGMVHQHFMLAGPHSALDNIILGAEPAWLGRLDRVSAKSRLQALAARYGLPVEWERAVEELSVGIQQRVEILKLLYRDASILILDEPTAVLTPQETNDLFRNLAKLRDEGKTILLITHKLKEVMAFTDRVTVFRTGEVVGETDTRETEPQKLAEMMVGRRVALETQVARGQVENAPGIEVTDLNVPGAVGARHRLLKVSFTIKRGEIVGIAGVEGNGQSELLQALLHPREHRSRGSGQVRFLGGDVSDWPTRKIRELGVAVIPEDRQAEGLLLNWSLSENFLLGREWNPSFQRGGWLKMERLAQASERAIRDYDVRPGDITLSAGSLSGGNQQKLIFAREFQTAPQVLLAAQPTRGVDVGAIEFIHQRIVRARDNGAAVLLISSELDEILALSDRILVMYEGRITAEFERGKVNERELGLKMGGLE
jgi:simple sugar transport system ATP-binding protein